MTAMDMMKRRRAMMGAASGTSGPLYQLHQGSNSRTGRNTIITGASIDDRNTGGSTGARNNYINATKRSDSIITTVWFALHAGDEVVLKIKNFTYTNSYTADMASYSLALKDGTGTTIIGRSYTLPRGNSSGSMADQTVTVSIQEDVNATCILFYAQRKSTAVYDLELWVNDVRYL